MIGLQFKPWRHIEAVHDRAAIRAWLARMASNAHFAFRAGMESSRGGRVYRKRGGRLHRASAPGAWPAVDTGKLKGSIRTQTTDVSMTIGTGQFYAIFLRNGTRKMARRKMSPEALKRGREMTPMSNFRFAKFRVG